MVFRKYSEAIRQGGGREYSAKIEHSGSGFYFPLGSSNARRAAAKAAEIHRTVLDQGWPSVLARFTREITLAIFWSHRPVACTYCTLFTHPCESGRPASPLGEGDVSAGQRARVALIESEPSVRQALARWLSALPQFGCASIHPTAREGLRLAALRRVDLVLFNQKLPDLPGGEFLERIRKLAPQIPAYAYGVFSTSDDIFASVSGVDEGYYLRRRPAEALLEPIHGAWREGPAPPARIQLQVRRYFQEMFGVRSPGRAAAADTTGLTQRECDILNCLAKGYQDKEIAAALQISAGTVHTHVKNAFEKLGVHTRTEAVMKYLQK